MRIFKDMELVGQLGSGVPRVLQTYGRECFKFSDNYIRMSFPIDDVVEDVVDDVVDNERKIIELIVENNRYSATQMAGKLELSQRTIQRYLKQLQDKKIIKRIGSAKSGYWKIIKKQ